MRHAWDSYVTYAWGHDELDPIAKRGKDGFGGLGATVTTSASLPSGAIAVKLGVSFLQNANCVHVCLADCRLFGHAVDYGYEGRIQKGSRLGGRDAGLPKVRVCTS